MHYNVSNWIEIREYKRTSLLTFTFFCKWSRDYNRMHYVDVFVKSHGKFSKLEYVIMKLYYEKFITSQHVYHFLKMSFPSNVYVTKAICINSFRSHIISIFEHDEIKAQFVFAKYINAKS